MTDRAPPPRAVRAVLFDLDDTLWHYADLPPASVIADAVAERIQRVFDGRGVRPMLPAIEINRALLARHVATDDDAPGAETRVPDRRALVRDVLARAGMAPSDELVDEVRAAFSRGNELLRCRPFDDAIPTLAALRGRGLRLGAITNRWYCGNSFRDDLDGCGLGELLEVVVCSDAFGWRKPDARVFEHALAMLGVAAAEAAFVGDRLDTDVRGARTAGLLAVWKCPDRLAGPDAASDRPDATVDRLGALLDLPALGGGRASLPPP